MILDLCFAINGDPLSTKKIYGIDRMTLDPPATCHPSWIVLKTKKNYGVIFPNKVGFHHCQRNLTKWMQMRLILKPFKPFKLLGPTFFKGKEIDFLTLHKLVANMWDLATLKWWWVQKKTGSHKCQSKHIRWFHWWGTHLQKYMRTQSSNWESTISPCLIIPTTLWKQPCYLV